MTIKQDFGADLIRARCHDAATAALRAAFANPAFQEDGKVVWTVPDQGHDFRDDLSADDRAVMISGDCLVCGKPAGAHSLTPYSLPVPPLQLLDQWFGLDRIAQAIADRVLAATVADATTGLLFPDAPRAPDAVAVFDGVAGAPTKTPSAWGRLMCRLGRHRMKRAAEFPSKDLPTVHGDECARGCGRRFTFTHYVPKSSPPVIHYQNNPRMLAKLKRQELKARRWRDRLAATGRLPRAADAAADTPAGE